MNSYHGAEKPGFAAVRRKSENPITSANIKKQIPSQVRYAAFWLRHCNGSRKIPGTVSFCTKVQIALWLKPHGSENAGYTGM